MAKIKMRVFNQDISRILRRNADWKKYVVDIMWCDVYINIF